MNEQDAWAAFISEDVSFWPVIDYSVLSWKLWTNTWLYIWRFENISSFVQIVSDGFTVCSMFVL